MLKGYQRRLIMMPTKGSPLFETAYFILRKETDVKAPNQNEMLCEATRILEETTLTAKAPTFKRRHIALALGIGICVGAVVMGILWLTLS